MANAIYDKWREQIIQVTASAALNHASGVWAALIDTGTYTFSQAHEFYTDLSGVVGTDVELGSKTFTSGVLDAADSTWTAVSGASCEAIVLYVKNGGASSTWRLFAYIDTGFTGLPVTPNGGNIVVTWNASGIVKI